MDSVGLPSDKFAKLFFAYSSWILRWETYFIPSMLSLDSLSFPRLVFMNHVKCVVCNSVGCLLCTLLCVFLECPLAFHV